MVDAYHEKNPPNIRSRCGKKAVPQRRLRSLHGSVGVKVCLEDLAEKGLQ